MIAFNDQWDLQIVVRVILTTLKFWGQDKATCITAALVICSENTKYKKIQQKQWSLTLNTTKPMLGE